MTTPIIETQSLSINFGGLRAVDQVSMRIAPGGITSIIGPNGAGKSTFFNLLSGALAPTSGRIFLKGVDVTGSSPSALRKLGLSRSFQITNVFKDMHVFENLRLAAQILDSHGLLPVTASEIAIARAEEMIVRFGLAAKANEFAGYLSHGEQRRLEIAMALASKPRLLLLDEPTQGMSHADTMDAKDIIRSIGDEITVVLIEHDIDLVMDLSRDVIVLYQGMLLAQGSPEAIQADSRVQTAYLGEE